MNPELLNVYIRQPFTQASNEEQNIVSSVLNHIKECDGVKNKFNYLTGDSSENSDTFKKSFSSRTGLQFTPVNFRNHRINLLNHADVFINIRVAMSESTAFELAYHIYCGKNTPILNLIWSKSPMKTTLLQDLSDVGNVAYIEFTEAIELKRKLHDYFTNF